MIVYWKQRVSPNIQIDADKYGNPIYKYEEVFGEVIGAYSRGNGSSGNMLVIAKPDGKISNITIDSCYHKSEIIEE